MDFWSNLTLPTLVPEAIYRGSEERSESPLVESIGNSMLSQVQKLNLDDDWLTYSLSLYSGTRVDFAKSTKKNSCSENQVWPEVMILGAHQKRVGI